MAPARGGVRRVGIAGAEVVWLYAGTSPSTGRSAITIATAAEDDWEMAVRGWTGLSGGVDVGDGRATMTGSVAVAPTRW